MSEEMTQNMPEGRSFEERVFARFDAIDARLQSLENQAERRALETKPIWERALTEILELKVAILELKEGLANVERKIDVLSRDIVQVRADHVRVERRLEKLESEPAQ